MKVLKTSLVDCLILQPDVFQDSRGFFMETYRSNQFALHAGIPDNFLQDNHSHSSKGVFRGLHFQKNNPQGKLVRASRGTVLDVVVDLRIESKTFGKSEVFEISDKNFHQIWVPPGFAHGFLVTSDVADFQYKCTQYYDPADEQIIHWADPDLNISWPTDIKMIVSEKDSNAQSFQDYCNQVVRVT
jgi:dTDP-4-dehydrorhamnose 3,5-epimerase|tara:strand:- start:2050 stop:2607 length:558 start_codon:yes stop_codon:yes gene_type:complete